MAAARQGVHNDVPSRRMRVGVGQLLLGALALTLAALLFAVASLRRLDGGGGAVISSQTSLAAPPPPGSRRDAEKGGRAGRKKSDAAGTSPDAKNSFHFIVSSDCTSYQRWETLTQLHSAQSVRQCGRFTWIVSGCLEEDSAHLGKGKGGAHSDILTPSSLLAEVERHFPHLTISNHTIATGVGRSSSVAHAHEDDCSMLHPHVHFTPDFSDMRVYGGKYADGKTRRSFLNRKGKVVYGTYGNTYKFNNKPNGLHHWAVDFLAQDDRRDEAIVLIDPDFLFLAQFEFPEGTPPVSPGKPAAAKYGLGGQFLDFNLTQICNQAPSLESSKGPGLRTCPFVTITNKDVNQYYSAGPPYIIHIQDVLSLSKRWLDLVPPTYDFYPLLYAEMFAYSMAAADLGLKHNLITGLFTGCMTHWPHTHGDAELKSLERSAKIYANSVGGAQEGGDDTDRGASSCFLPPLTPPPFLHYCARYSFATPYPLESNPEGTTPTYHFFAKRRVDDDVLDCSHSHQLEPFVSTKQEKGEGGDKNWNVLAVCAVVRSINRAKKKGCENDMQ